MFDHFFDSIDSNKSYFLGWILSQNHLHDKDILHITFNNIDLLAYIRNIFNKDITIYENQSKFYFDIKLPTLYKTIQSILNNQFHFDFPFDFIRGYYDFNSSLNINDNIPECIIQGRHFKLIHTLASCKSILHHDKLIYKDDNCIDFLGLIYQNINGICDFNKYSQYKDILIHHNSINKLPTCSIFKKHPNAIIPSKTFESDVGYDLTIIKEHKTISDKIKLYDTGIRIKVDYGYYAEIYPRSSLSKSGYMLANSVGIIDRGYTNNIYIALTKIDDNMPNIELPFRCCQIIFRKQQLVHIIETNDDFQETNRDKGGFGSTSNK